MAEPARQLDDSGYENPYTPGHIWKPNTSESGDPAAFGQAPKPDIPQLRKLEGEARGDGMPAGQLASVPTSSQSSYSPASRAQPEVSRPELRALEGGGESSAPQGRLSEVKPVYDEPTGTAPSTAIPAVSPAASGAEGSESEPEQDPSESSEDEQSEKEEKKDASDESSLYKKPGEHSFDFGNRFSLRGRISRRRALFGGGMLGTIIAILMIISFSAGPLEFVHVAQLMQRFHFSHQQDAGDDRMGRLYRFMRSGGDVGETRLGWLGSKMKNNMLAQLEEIGLKPDYKTGTIYEGFTIDTENPKSPYFGMNEDEVKSALKEKGITKGVSSENGKVKVTVEGYRNQKKSLKFLVDQLGKSKTPTAIRVRVLSRYGLVSRNWHPMTILDRKAKAKLADLYAKWLKSRTEDLKRGTKATNLDGTRTQVRDTDPNGNETVTNEGGDNAPLDDQKTKTTLEKIGQSHTLRIAGGVAAAAGVVCAIREVNDNMGQIRYVQVVMPLARMGMDAVTVGSQIMSGQDVDSDTVSFLAKNFEELDSKGNVVSTWDQAKSIQSELGRSGGIDIEDKVSGSDQKPQDGIKEALAGNVPSWISWTNNGKVSALCSGVGKTVVGIISIGLGILSGGLFSTVGGMVVGAIAQPLAIDKISHLLAGETVNVAAKGAMWGNNVNFGSRIAANAMSLLFGGVPLSKTQVAELDAQQTAKSNAEFQSKSIAYRLFNANDYRSAISRVIDGSSPSITRNINKIASVFTGFGSNISALPSILSPKVHAASEPYDYGFPEFGFSDEDLNNSAVADPYENANAAASILDSADGESYIKKAKECFGVNIIKSNSDGQGDLWDVVPGDGDGAFSPDSNPYSPADYPQDCASPNNLDAGNWLKIRFFIFDTGVMEGYACFQGDDTSCTNDGLSSGSAAGSSPTSGPSQGGGSLPNGSAQDLAKQLLPFINSGKVTCLSSGCPDIVNTANGKGTKYGSCYVDSLDPALVGMLLKLAQMGHTFFLSAVCSDHASNPTSLHHQGKAVDFNFIDGVFMGPSATEPWSQAKTQAAAKLDQDIASFMPKSTGFGQVQCHPAFSFLSGFNAFSDACHHQHVDVGGY